MGKNVADIKLTANSGIELPLPNLKDVKKVLILGNTIGFFGYPGEGCNISNIHGEDAKRFAWMYNCALLGVEIEILGEIEEFDYYSDLFQKIKERYGYKVNTTFTVMKCNDDYDRKLNEYIEEMEDTGKKRFDYAIMNPPYYKNLHLKILEKVIKVTEKTINISPIRWLQDPYAKNKKTSDWNRFKSGVLDKIEDLYILKQDDATEVFEALLSSDIGIYTCSDKGGYNCENIVNPIIRKILSKKNTGNPVFEQGKKDGWRVRIATIVDTVGGHFVRGKKMLNTIGKMIYFYDGKRDGKPWYEFYQRNQHSKITEEITWSIGFNSESEAKNFCDSQNTAVAKFFTHYVKVDVNVHPYVILWMDDYTKPWTNARFCEYFGITGFVSDTEAEPGSEWETILETMKKYA